jgi:hypothetical protein
LSSGEILLAASPMISSHRSVAACRTTVALWTLAFVLVAFNASSAAGIFMLLIGGPIFFIISMIYVRVGLEILIAFFKIHGDVSEINVRTGGTTASEAAPEAEAPPTTEAGPAAAPA